MSAHLTIWYFRRPLDACKTKHESSLSKVPCIPSGRMYISIIYIGRLKRQESISTDLLPLEVNFPHKQLERPSSRKEEASGVEDIFYLVIPTCNITIKLILNPT